MAIDTIKSSAVLDGAIATADIADDAVTSAKLDTNISVDGNLGLGTSVSTRKLNVNAGSYGHMLLDTADAAHGIQILGQANAASNSGFDIQYAASTGMKIRTLAVQPLSLQTSASAGSPSAGIAISTAGEVTMTRQPAFFVENSAQQANLSINGVNTIVLNTERIDQGGDFASNTFTAPVTGSYQLQFALTLRNLDSAADYIRFRIGTSNKSYDFFIDPNFDSSSPDYDSVFQLFSASVLADMDASDTCTLGYYQAGGTAQSDINANEAFFSGFLVA